jgi:hypothetical protein
MVGRQWGGSSSRHACRHAGFANDGQKGQAMLDTIKDKTGIYRLGFNKYSFLGIVLPLAFVIVVGGAISAFVLMN